MFAGTREGGATNNFALFELLEALTFNTATRIDDFCFPLFFWIFYAAICPVETYVLPRF